MPADFIITTGHMLQITMNPPETYPTLIAPLPLIGTSSSLMVCKMPACLEGDETPAMLLAPQPYISPTFYTTPGMGTKNGSAILIKGQTFPIEFSVTVPAIYVNEVSGVPTPDSVMKKMGTGQFISTNMQVKGA